MYLSRRSTLLRKENCPVASAFVLVVPVLLLILFGLVMSASLDITSPAHKKALRLHNKSKRTPAAENLPILRQQEKAFKARFPPPSLSDVLDLSWNEDIHGNVWRGTATVAGLHRIQCADANTAYTIDSLPGQYNMH